MPDLFIFLCNILFLIILSGFFSSSETALTAVSEARIHELALQGNKRAITIESILAKKEKMISTILIGNNLVNIVASVYATSFAIIYFGEFDLIFVTILLTIVLVIFAEVIPKTYAFSHSDQVALTVAPIINFFIFLLTPATFITERFAKIVSGPVINDEEAKLLTKEFNLIKCAKKMMQWGAKYVIIKKGEHGSLMFYDDVVFPTAGFSLENVVDPTGAGDSFAGAMIGYLASKNTTKISEIKKAVVYGNVLGSFAVEKYGLDGLLKIKKGDIGKRIKSYEKMIQF